MNAPEFHSDAHEIHIRSCHVRAQRREMAAQDEIIDRLLLNRIRAGRRALAPLTSPRNHD